MAVFDRYHITHPVEGLVATEMTLQDAFETAHRWINSNTGYADAGTATEIFDAMARRGQVRLWRTANGGETWTEAQRR